MPVALGIDLRDLEYAALRQSLKDLIPDLTPYWVEYHDADPGIVLLDLLAAISDLLAYYLDKRTNEMILTRAVTKKAVIDQGRLFDYRLTRRIAPAVDVTVQIAPSITPPLGADIVLPQGVSVISNSGALYALKAPVTFTAASDPVLMPFYQGIYTEDIFTSAGEDNQTYVLSRPNVAANFLEVYVTHGMGSPTLWTEDVFEPPPPSAGFSEMGFVDPNSVYTKYVVDVDDQGVATLEFNKFKYDVPQATDRIEVHYISTNGPAGNVASSAIQGWSSGRVDTSAISPYLTVSNSNPSYGAAVEEDFTTIKKKIPYFLATLWRCVSLKDFEFVACLYPGVNSASSRVSLTDRFTVQVYFQMQTGDGSGVTSLIQAFLQAYSVIGITVDCIPATHVPVDVSIQADLSSRAVRTVVDTAIRDALTTFFLQANQPVGQDVLIDAVYSVVSAVSDIERFQITVLDRAGDTGVGHVVMDPTEYASLGTVSLFLSGGS